MQGRGLTSYLRGFNDSLFHIVLLLLEGRVDQGQLVIVGDAFPPLAALHYLEVLSGRARRRVGVGSGEEGLGWLPMESAPKGCQGPGLADPSGTSPNPWGLRCLPL